MNIGRFSFKNSIISVFLAFSLTFVLSNQSLAANYELEIIQPQANLDITNRFYKAYPGLVYNVRLAVIGGAYPYRFELVSGPKGMLIDDKKGVINWPNPVEAQTPYAVQVRVQDAESVSRDVTWNITVTPTGFRFIDAVNGTPVNADGSGGDGSIDNPWKSLKDMYGGSDQNAKYTKTYAGEFIYWRAGRYQMDAFIENNGERVPFISNNKPLVWLAYPGEKPVLDLSRAYIAIYQGGSNTYFDGLEIDVNKTSRGMGVQIASSANNVTFRNNIAHGITTGYVGGNNACFFVSKNKVGLYWAFQDNEMFDVNSGYGILGYNARKLLVEDNVLHEIGGIPIGPKTGTGMWFIRANSMYNNPRDSINVQYYKSKEAVSGDIEISYNVVDAGGGRVRINAQQEQLGNPIYIFRNTFMDAVQQNRVSSTNGLFKWYDNVIVNNTSFPDKIERTNIDDPSRLSVIDNITGGLSDKIVDSEGFLLPSYSMFIGTKGHQVGTRPLPPTSLTVN